YRAVEETKHQARAELLPQVALDANLLFERQNVLSSSSQFFQPSTIYSNTKGYDLSLSQALYHRDLFVQLRATDAAIVQAAASYQAAQQDLAVRATDRYFKVLAAADDLKFAQAEKQ